MEEAHAAHEHVSPHETSRLVRWAAVAIAIFSAAAALTGHEASELGTKALIYKSEAAIKKTDAANQWSYYQAVSAKAHIMDLGQRLLPPEQAKKEAEKIAKYEKQKAEIQAKAETLERSFRDSDRAASALLEPRESFLTALILLQMAIALGSITILTRMTPFFFVMLGLGVAGLGYGVFGAFTM
ncbi:MAG: DUF4337 domain-containing protein [Rhodospirillaceae bacterium]|nr:DUF4337 domain-containing protein [Rhodospirillaceae bacterium]